MNNSNDKNSYPVGGTARRTTIGTFLEFLGQGVKVLEHILLVPLFLWAWGSALYGEWLTLFSVVAYLSLSDVGIANFVSNRMIYHYSGGDVRNYVRTLKSALSLYVVIAGVLSLFLIIFAFKAPFFDWFDLATASETSVRISILILGAYILWGNLTGLINNLYICIGEFVRYRIFTNIKEILLLGFIALTLFFKGEFISVASWYLVFLFMFPIFVIWDTRRRHPEIDFKSAKTDWKLGASFIVPGFIFLMIPLAEMIKLQGSVLLISSSLGAVAVATFSIHRTLANLASRLTTVLQSAIRPELTADDARGNYEKIQLIHNILTKIVFLVSISAVVFLFFTGEDIIRVWTGGKIEFQPVVWLIFLIGLPIASLWHFSSVFQVATNKYTAYSIVRIISAVSGLVLAFLFAKSWGVAGILFGFLLGDVVFNFWFVPYKTLKIIKISVKRYIFMMIKGLPIIIIQLPLAWLLNEYITNVWLRLVLIGIVVVVAGTAFTYFSWLNQDERKPIINLLKNYKSGRF